METVLNSVRAEGRRLNGSEGSFPRFLDRTARILDAVALERLRSARVLIAGCGGVGGAAALTLARLGVGNFILADPGRFDEPDANRQWAADTGTMGRNKARAYGRWLRRINPEIRAAIHPEGIRPENVERLVADADLVIDCLDISVEPELRRRLFERARQCGIHAITAPVLGFGVLVVVAAPDGMPMDPFLQMVGKAASTGHLPPGLRRVYSPRCLDALERDLPGGKLPSLAIGPVLGGALVSTEALLILLQGFRDLGRPPVCLPGVLLADPLTGRCQTAELADLEPARAPDTRERAELLRQAGWNPHRLRPEHVAIDVRTDSWAEIATPVAEEAPAVGDPEERFQELYGYPHTLAVPRGRFAEALLAAALLQPGDTVAGNALFPTARFHIETRGARLVELNAGLSANMDLGVLRERLRARELSCVWVEACANAAAGAPLSLANLQATCDLCRAAEVPLVLDATRLIDNALLEDDRAGTELLHEFARHTDLCVLSASKDFPARHGGFVAAHDAARFARLKDLRIAFGGELTADHRSTLAGAMQADPFPAVRERMKQVRQLRQRLAALRVPLYGPPGGHAVVVDAGRLLPHLTADRYPVQALANELYRQVGVRAGGHFLSPAQCAEGLALLRLAVPISRYGPEAIDRIVQAFEAIARRPEAIGGLRSLTPPDGPLGELNARFELLRGGQP